MAHVKIKARPWQTPDFIVLDISTGEETFSVALRDADPGAVQELVVAWMAEVYSKAGMQPNWRFQ